MIERAPRIRVQRRPVHGVLLLDKPLGLSSNNALQKVKWLLRAEKAGHTGTLDPLATGVLPLCFGAATKFSALQLDAPKTYEAVALLGITTSTGDAEGEVLQRRDVDPGQLTPERLAQVQAQFTGAIRQVPPMHSALKKDGKALYEYARAGVEVERAPRDVTIHALELAVSQVGKAQTAIKIIVTCSKGTYIRTLVEDIGRELGCGGHVAELRRTQAGPFVLAQAISLETLEKAHAEGGSEALDQFLLPSDSGLEHWPLLQLSEHSAYYWLHGQPVRAPEAPKFGMVRVQDHTGRFIGIGEVSDDGRIAPKRLISTSF